MLYRRILPLFTALLTLVLCEWFFYTPKMIYTIAALINVYYLFALWYLSRSSKVDKKWWNYLILPALMTSSVIAYSIFLSDKTIIQLLFICNVILLYLYLRYVYYYLHNPAAYIISSIENISTYCNFLTFFLLSGCIYGLLSFLNISVWLLEVIFFFISSLIIYQIIWSNKIELRKGSYLILTCSLILVELSWAVSFLPFNYNISGLIIAVCYYILTGLVKNYLLEKLDIKRIKMYLGLGLVSLFLIIFTAKWL